jgi:ribosomal protein S18 acetylase RimI-like enzyme
MNAAAAADIRLRALRDDDAAFLRRVYASTRLEELAPLGWSAEQIDAFIDMQNEAQRRDYWRNYDTSRFQIITCAGADAGRLYVERRADELRIVDIALLPEWRGKGIGAHLIGRLFEEADQAGLPVRIHVEYGNPAQRLYQRLGFVFRGEAVGVHRLMERVPATQA